jgi:hypothetical protein
MLFNIATLKNEAGFFEVHCGDNACLGLAESTLAGNIPSELSYTLTCSRCGKMLGEWATSQARTDEIADAVVRAHFAA